MTQSSRIDQVDRSLCLVVGASGAIGTAIVESMRGHGFDVAGVSRSRPDGWVGRYLECDLSDLASIGSIAGELEVLRPMVIVNAAGVGAGDSIETLSAEQMLRVFSVNLFGPALLTSAAVRGMPDRGTVVNVCSNVMLGKANRSSYASSKAALDALSRSWALDLAPRGIRVNSVSPGPVDSPLFRNHRPVGSDAAREAVERIPLQRLLQPAEVASVVLFLATAASGTMTGQTLTVDGGESLAGAR